MSLIGDALRKARQEAADRESDRKGILFSAKIADGPARSGLGLGLALGAMIAIVATVAGGFAVWWILGGGSSTESSGTVALQEAPVQPVDSDPPATDSESASESVSETETESVPVPVPDDSDSGSGSISNNADGDSISSESANHDSAVQTSSPTPQALGSESGFVGVENGEEIYIMEADLGGVRLSLDFIVFRPEDSYAEINGTEVHIGGTVDGWRVKEIERDRVSLSDGRKTIVLRAP